MVFHKLKQHRSVMVYLNLVPRPPLLTCAFVQWDCCACRQLKAGRCQVDAGGGGGGSGTSLMCVLYQSKQSQGFRVLLM